jgi:hypothetical protein
LDASIVNRKEMEKVNETVKWGLSTAITVIIILVSVYAATLGRAWLLVIREESELRPSDTKHPEMVQCSESEPEELNKKREKTEEV